MPKIRNSKKIRSNRRETVPYGSIRPVYTPGNAVQMMDIEVYVGKITTTVTTGAIAQAYAINAGLIANFGARFVAFDEYLLESFKLRVDTCSSNLAGLLNIWFEPNIASTSAPAAADAKNNKTLTFSAGSNGKTHTLMFNPKNVVTQAWTPISTTTAAFGYLKVYTDAANFASSIVATDYAVLTGIMRVYFRGFA
jgi:hypothetical protein